MGTSISADQQITFGPFLLRPAEQLLLEYGKPVRVGSRALEILATLVERAGNLVSKDELIQRVWPNTVVEEDNLKVQIAALRRALGDGRGGNRYIVNVPGRGYRFVAAVSSRQALVTASATGTAARSPGLPASLTRIIGRSDFILTTATLLSERRFVTLVGPGGIGKTTVALAVAAEALSYSDGRMFADLAPLTDPLLLPSSLASLLGIALHSDNPVPRLLNFLENKQILIVFDSCEHILAAVATLAEALLKGAPRLHILATSREPLRAEGEAVRRLPSLDIPPPTDLLTAEEAVSFSAVQLFVDRAGSSSEDFQLKDVDANHVAEICRRLDGNALAIELAAGRVEAFGIEGVASRLVDRFNLLTGGRRTALPRHQALGATLDWSYDLLTNAERAVLRRLSVFVGNFTLDAATSVVADDVTSETDVICCVANLVSKSLVSAETNIRRPRYRLLDTTSAYSRQKLKECNEFRDFARRHAEYYRDLFEQAGLECVTQNAADWLLVYGEQIDNVRAALNWAFSAEGNFSTGVALTIAVVPLWLNLSLMDECLQRVKKALFRLDGGHVQAPTRKMQLYTALGVALYLIGPGPETKAAWKQVQAIAESLANTDYRLRALWGLWTVCVTGGEHRTGLSLAHEFTKLAEEASDSEAQLVGERLIGTSHHFLGEQEDARRRIGRMLDRSTSLVDPSDIIRFHCNQSVAARSYLAKVLWLQGYPEQALREVEHSISDARAAIHSHSLCYALASGACPIAVFVGDLLVADRYVTMLLDQAVTHRLALWTKMGRGFKGTVLIRRGDLSAGVPLLRTAIDELHRAGYALYHTAFLLELAQGLANGGQAPLGLTIISEALAQAIRNGELWCVPELLRVKGEIALLQSGSGAQTVAEESFAESLDLARQQKASSWELRTALSLARLRRSQSRGCEARSLLWVAYSTFKEGFGTADLRSARKMLDDLNGNLGT